MSRNLGVLFGLALAGCFRATGFCASDADCPADHQCGADDRCAPRAATPCARPYGCAVDLMMAADLRPPADLWGRPDSNIQPPPPDGEPSLSAIALTPTNSINAMGASIAFAALGTYSNGTSANLTPLAAWTASDPGVLTISNAPGSQGSASAVNLGVVTVRAAYGGITGATNITIESPPLAITVSPAATTLSPGVMSQLVAVGSFVSGQQNITERATWISARPDYATVSDEAGKKGQVRAVSAGLATITASYGGRSLAVVVNVQ